MYNYLSELLGERESKKLLNNTYLVRSGKKIAVRLHNTDVVTFTPKTITLNSGGWLTVTTKDRMNKYLPSNVKVFANKGEWFVSQNDKIIPFKDGMRIRA